MPLKIQKHKPNMPVVFTSYQNQVAASAHENILGSIINSDCLPRANSEIVTQDSIKALADHKCQMLICGHNKLWKTESEMGRTGNRRFHNLPHTKFLTLLRSACEAHNILFLTTEESYTSKSSFLNSATIPTYSETKPSENQTTVIKTNHLGRRTKHQYKNQSPESKPSGWKQTIHADLNGAYNIARKILHWFKFSAETCLEYSLLWISPKYGFKPFSSGILERSACPGYTVLHHDFGICTR